MVWWGEGSSGEFGPNVKIVQSGQTIQSVIDSITNASASNLYEVIVPPGHEDETSTEVNFVQIHFINSISHTANNSLMAALNAGQSTAIQVIGDSAGNQPEEWVYLLGEWLASEYPDLTILYHLWDDGDTDHDGVYAPVTTIQTGSSGVRYLTCDGTGGGQIGRDDFAGIVDDLDIRMRVDPPSWRPAADQYLCSWYYGTTSKSFHFRLTTSGGLRLEWSVDGSASSGNQGSTSAVAIGTTDPLWVRVTMDVDNGAADAEIKFYTSTDDVNESKSVTTWTQLGSTKLQGATTTLYHGANMDAIPIYVGRRTVTGPFEGNIYACEIYNEIDGVIPSIPIALDSVMKLSNGFVRNGSPVLHILNGSKAGCGYDYMSNNATLAKQMMPNYDQSIVFISLSHNEGACTGKTFLNKVSSYKITVSGLMPLADIVYVLQNPQTVAATNDHEHAIRRMQNMAWATNNGCQSIDVYKAFAQKDFSSLMTGTVHPNAAGQAVWVEAIKKYLGDENPYIIS